MVPKSITPLQNRRISNPNPRQCIAVKIKDLANDFVYFETSELRFLLQQAYSIASKYAKKGALVIVATLPGLAELESSTST